MARHADHAPDARVFVAVVARDYVRVHDASLMAGAHATGARVVGRGRISWERPPVIGSRDAATVCVMTAAAPGDLPIAEFAFPGELRDRILAAILTGEKTATTSLLVEYELDGEPMPQAGDRLVVVDSGERPVAMIELTDVRVLRLDQVDRDTAREEGEGFSGVEEWRVAHEAFWNGCIDDLRARLRDSTWTLSDETLVVVERFRLIHELDS